MRPTFVVTTASLLLLGAGVAEAAGSTQLAETGGFLLGNAHRCGVLTRSMHERRTSAKRRFDCSRFDCSGAGWARGIDPAAAGLVVCIG